MTQKSIQRNLPRWYLGSLLGLGLAAIGGTTFTYLTKIEPEAVEITKVTIPLPNLPEAFDGYSVVQISDWHLGEWMTLDRMLDIARQVNDLKPDVILMTGDFISKNQYHLHQKLTRAMSAFHARDGIFAVLGNHDYWVRNNAVARAIQAAGNCRLLLNSNAVICRDGTALHIAGIDDVWEGRHDLDAALQGIPAGSAVILLAHEPDKAEAAAATGRVGLQLSGHTHGGQIRLPFKGALVLPDLGEKYDMGLFNINGMGLYVNRGIGMVAPYVRFNCRPEITHFTLRIREFGASAARIPRKASRGVFVLGQGYKPVGVR
jgi:predicted MPP superfamily phosphohydrolase